MTERGPQIREKIGKILCFCHSPKNTVHSGANAGGVLFVTNGYGVMMYGALSGQWLNAASKRKQSFLDTYSIPLQCVWMVKLRLSGDLFNVRSL